MTNITITKKDNLISTIEICGHTLFDEYGKDILCASISSILITSINAIKRIDDDSIYYDIKSGKAKINVLKHDKYVDLLIENMIYEYKELEKKYNKNIKINEEV